MLLAGYDPALWGTGWLHNYELFTDELPIAPPRGLLMPRFVGRKNETVSLGSHCAGCFTRQLGNPKTEKMIKRVIRVIESLAKKAGVDTIIAG